MAAAASSSGSESNQSLATDSFTIYSFVDEVESRVELLRRQAASLMEEQKSLLVIIEQLKKDSMQCNITSEDFQELVANMERLKARCEAVQVEVHTVRDEGQIQALEKVNSALQELHIRLSNVGTIRSTAVKQAHTYLNACLPEAVGPADTRFQSMVLGCALDDQKHVRRQLEKLVRKCNTQPESISGFNSNVNSGNTADVQQSNNATASAESVVNTGAATEADIPQSVSDEDRPDAGSSNSDVNNGGAKDCNVSNASVNSSSVSNSSNITNSSSGGSNSSNSQENYLSELFYSAPKDSIAFDGRP